ncbi:MAG: hypothetical protein WBS24_03440 [Terriglobales bacterium]
METEPALEKVRLYSKILEASEIQLNDAVVSAKLDGVTWEQIADALGMTRQGAAQRYGKFVAQRVPS